MGEVEVEDVLARPGEERQVGENARVATGQTRAGRYLRVVFVVDDVDNSALVVTAYDLRGRPLTAYRRRRRRE